MSILTKEELEAIRKRAEAATPGPWSWWDDGTLYSEGVEIILGKAVEGEDGIWFDLFDNVAEFIATSREDIPKLLAEIERLQQEKDEWYEKYMRLDATVSTQYKQLEKANAEIERLNDVIKQLTETTESFLDDKHFYMDELKKTEEALREIDTHIRATSGPVPYIIETLKRVLPEYNENEGDRV